MLKIVFCKAANDDIHNIISVVKDTYNCEYFEKKVYKPEYYKKIISNSSNNVFLAKSNNGEIAALLTTMTNVNYPNSVEIGLVICASKFRNKGISTKLIEYVIKQMAKFDVNSIYASIVTYHSCSQAMFEKLNFISCGFHLGRADNVFNFVKLYNENITEINNCIAVLPLNFIKTTYYVSDRIKHIFEESASNLNCNYLICNNLNIPLKEKCNCEICRFEDYDNVDIYFKDFGWDFEKVISGVLSKKRNIFLNMQNENCVWAYEFALKFGFVFTGFHFLGGDVNYLIMNYCENRVFDGTNFTLTKKNQTLLNEIYNII